MTDIERLKSLNIPKECEMYGTIQRAIKALEIIEKDKTEQEDCISREQAKEEIRKAFPQLKDRVEINSILNGLPSVKPKEDILDKIRAEIMDFEEDIFHSTKDYSDYAAVRRCVDIIDKYRQEG